MDCVVVHGFSVNTLNEYDPTLHETLSDPGHVYTTFAMLISANLKGKLSVEVVVILDVKSAPPNSAVQLGAGKTVVTLTSKFSTSSAVDDDSSCISLAAGTYRAFPGGDNALLVESSKPYVHL